MDSSANRRHESQGRPWLRADLRSHTRGTDRSDHPVRLLGSICYTLSLESPCMMCYTLRSCRKVTSSCSHPDSRPPCWKPAFMAVCAWHVKQHYKPRIHEVMWERRYHHTLKRHWWKSYREPTPPEHPKTAQQTLCPRPKSSFLPASALITLGKDPSTRFYCIQISRSECLWRSSQPA